MKFILIFLYSISGFSKVDLVFDLDYTLFYEIIEGSHSNQITALQDGKVEKYIVSDWALEVIENLYLSNDFRISFFSGGTHERNKYLLKKTILPNIKVSLWDIAYKVLSREDLTPVEGAPKLGKWSDRYKKDLKKINIDLSNIISIDDNLNFYLQSQRENVYWVGEGYFYFENWNEVSKLIAEGGPHMQSKWLPPTALDHWADRNKLILAYLNLKEAKSRHDFNGGTYLESFNKLTRNFRGERIIRTSQSQIIKTQLELIKFEKQWKKKAKIIFPCLGYTNI